MFDLESAISEAFAANEAQNTASALAVYQEHQSRIDRETQNFCLALSEVIPIEVQESLGMKIERSVTPVATFHYLGNTYMVEYSRESSIWLLWKYGCSTSYVLGVEPHVVLNALLIYLGTERNLAKSLAHFKANLQ